MIVICPYFTEPASRPRTRYFCIAKNTTSGTAIETKAAVARISQLPPRVPSKFDDLVGHHRGLAGRVDQEHLGDQQVVPGPQELEDREGGQRRERQRQDDLGEDLEIRGAVDLGVLDDVARQADHVVAQEIDRQRQAEPGMGQPDAQIALADADAQMQLQQRDQRQLQRHHQQRRRPARSAARGRENPSRPAHRRQRPRSRSG